MSFTVLARWNLGVIAPILGILLVMRNGWHALFRYVLGACLPGILWLAVSAVFVDSPLRVVYEENFRPALQWAGEGESKPTTFTRAAFYLRNWYFLTPLGLAGIFTATLVSLRRFGVSHRSSTPSFWAWMHVAPACLLSYMFAMLFIGGHFERFMTPIVPVAALILFKLVDHASELLDAEQVLRLSIVSAATLIGLGIYGHGPILSIQLNVRADPPLPAQLADEYLAARPSDNGIYAVPTARLSAANAGPLMYQLKRQVKIIGATRDATGNILAESPTAELMLRAWEKVPPGADLIVEGPAPPGAQLLASEGNLGIFRRPLDSFSRD